jgi:hypothetical protein
MEMKTISRTVLIFFCICPSLVYGQINGQKELARFIVTDATEDMIHDITPDILSMGTYTVFYLTENDSRMYMANVCSNEDSQSYGYIYNLGTSHEPETKQTYETATFTFNWKYYNTYDGRSGTCKCMLKKVYKPQGVVSSLQMITEDLRLIVYKGYMEGTLNFSKYF